MIRALYRWRLAPGRRADFERWWHEGTLRIRSARNGALGSTLLAPAADDAHVVALARWRSQDDLEAFWVDPGGREFDGAELESVELFEELDDLTVSGPITDMP